MSVLFLSLLLCLLCLPSSSITPLLVSHVFLFDSPQLYIDWCIQELLLIADLFVSSRRTVFTVFVDFWASDDMKLLIIVTEFFSVQMKSWLIWHFCSALCNFCHNNKPIRWLLAFLWFGAMSFVYRPNCLLLCSFSVIPLKFDLAELCFDNSNGQERSSQMHCPLLYL